jgi:iron complex transport system ATP-binding protein
MLKAIGITYRVGNKTLLDDVSVSFEPGKLNLIIGPNGAGKSTLVKILCNQLKPISGSVLYDDTNLEEISVGELAKYRAVLSQSTDLAFPMKVYEVVMMGRYPHFSGRPQAKDLNACEEAMRFFGVLEMSERDYITLSGGEKQRVHFARVLAQIWYPREKGLRYLILDEPLTFLDVHYQFSFMNKLVELLKAKDLVVVGVVHDLNLAAKFADCVLLLNKGGVLANGTKEKVLIAENIQEAYGLEPLVVNQDGEIYLFFR